MTVVDIYDIVYLQSCFHDEFAKEDMIGNKCPNDFAEQIWNIS